MVEQYKKVKGETLVFVGSEPQKLRFVPLYNSKLTLCGPEPDCVEFQEGIDYLVNYSERTISRTDQSKIPDWRSHPLYEKENFDHRCYSDYRNANFTCTVNYIYESNKINPKTNVDIANILPHFIKRLQMGGKAKYVVFGDSISTGMEATKPEFAYHKRFIKSLQGKFPNTTVNVEMKALGGENSSGGLLRLEKDVISMQPDLVTIAYGMNDQNRQLDGSNAISLNEFSRNISTMVKGIKKQTPADIILITPCLPNDKWIFASENMKEYAEAICSIGVKESIVVADVYQSWQQELYAGKTHESLLLNNLNHPNNYGHSIYHSTLQKLLGIY